MAAVESGLGIALVAARTAHRLPRRVRLKKLSAAPEPLRAVSHRVSRLDDKPLAVFVEELRSRSGPRGESLAP
jgi:DNA-binding transcriptional LysR family regulator